MAALKSSVKVGAREPRTTIKMKDKIVGGGGEQAVREVARTSEGGCQLGRRTRFHLPSDDHENLQRVGKSSDVGSNDSRKHQTKERREVEKQRPQKRK